MKNTGTWNSDLALWFVFIFFLPTFLYMLANLCRLANSTTDCQNVLPDVVGSDIIVDTDYTAMANMQAELESVKQELSKLKTKRKKSKTDQRDKIIMQETATALNKLGVQKSRANSVVKNLCKERPYNSSEDLLQDAIVYIG
jgi:hypothetical protein